MSAETDARPNPLGLKVGDRLKDNDARTGGRRIIAISHFQCPGGKWYAEYFSGHRRCKIAFEHIHTDGLPRSQGYNLIKG